MKIEASWDDFQSWSYSPPRILDIQKNPHPLGLKSKFSIRNNFNLLFDYSEAELVQSLKLHKVSELRLFSVRWRVGWEFCKNFNGHWIPVALSSTRIEDFF